MTSKIKISVCTITYGHEKYLSQSIEGVLMQEGDFELEFIIANDCSPDNTDQIIRHYMDNHPKGAVIKYLNRAQNMGVMPNFIDAIQQCTGNYIALCEGDDYWTYPLKLSEQLRALEGNQQLVLSCHNAEFKYENSNGNGLPVEVLNEKSKKRIATEDLRKALPIITGTAFFRNVIKEYPKAILEVVNGDTFLFSLLGCYGGVGYIDKLYSVYRVNEQGIWSSLSSYKKLQNTFFTAGKLAEFHSKTDKSIEKFFDDSVFKKVKELLITALMKRDFKGFYYVLVNFYLKNSRIGNLKYSQKFAVESVKYIFKKITKN